MIEQLWQDLEDEAMESGRRDTISRRLMPDSITQIFIGYDKQTDTRMLLLPIMDAKCLEKRLMPRTRGVEASIRQYPYLMGDTNVLTVSLRLPQFKRMFSVMVEEITMDLGGITCDDERISAVISGILKWQQLLEKLAPEGLGPEAQRGLFGELHFLKQYVLKLLSPLPAVNSWAGPNGANQDFHFPHCAVEIKTTASKRHELIHIANERQLDYSLVPSLYLIHFAIMDSGSDALTLPALVLLTREALRDDHSAIMVFNSRLLNVGYHDSQSMLYDRTKYRILSTTIYHVRDEFPRIIGADLRNGVGEIQYSITASECAHYTVDEECLMRGIRDN